MRHALWCVGTCLVVIAFLGMRQGSATARELGAKLTGNEILLELEKTKPGRGVPGIYAVDEEGKLTLVVAYGQHPRWAPDRTRFAFLQENQNWVADLNKASMYPLETLRIFEDAPCSLFGLALPEALQWMPDGRSLIRWNPEDYITPGGGDLPPAWPDYRGRMPWTVEIRGREPEVKPLIPPCHQGVGRVSVSPDGERIAFEAFDRVRDVGATNRSVWVFDRQTDKATRLVVPGITSGVLLNPLWAPDGKRLAVDWLREDRQRSILIYEPVSKKVWHVPARVPEDDHLQALEWSPDGGSILALGTKASGSNVFTYVIRAPSGEAPRIADGIGGLVETHRACWSPKGDAVVVLQGDEPRISGLPSDRLEVRVWPIVTEPGPAGTAAPEAKAQVPIPPDLRPVDLDW